jgi:glutamate 5-kinase
VRLETEKLEAKKRLEGSRIVVKVGSSSLTSVECGLRTDQVERVAKLLAESHSAGIQVVLVTSGAVASGAPSLGLPLPVRQQPLRRAAASVGQMRLMQEYAKACANFNIGVGQILLTRRDFALRTAYDSVRETIETLLSQGVLPIINENDSVSLHTDSFGDNDMLSALLASLLHADLLVIFTDTDGVYTDNPHTNPSAQKLSSISEINNSIYNGARGEGISRAGTGGMSAKLKAADQALILGVRSYIGSFEATSSIITIINGDGTGTYIGALQESRRNRKYQWIAFHSPVLGSVSIDNGAMIALIEHSRSLLPAGVIGVQGHFAAGGVITVTDTEGRVIAKGISNYTSAQITSALGKPTSYARETLKVEKDEIIHRNNLIMFV